MDYIISDLLSDDLIDPIVWFYWSGKDCEHSRVNRKYCHGQQINMAFNKNVVGTGEEAKSKRLTR